MTSLTRRSLLIGLPAVAALAATTRIAFAQQYGETPEAPAPFVLPPLKYGFDALAPYIDAETMQLHHDRHHGAAVATLNTLAKDHPDLAQWPIETILGDLNSLPEAIRTGVRNNLGSHANHSMFWEIMGPSGGAPSGAVLAAIDRDLGGLEKLKTDFNAAGARQFGSGWAFVTVTLDGQLAIEARPNQDTPLMEGKRVLFGNDVWEHAYYLTYRNVRADYLAAWWNVVDWSAIASRYDRALAGTLTV